VWMRPPRTPSPLRVTAEGYRSAGETLAALGLATVVVQEGGYHLPSLGHLVVTFLAAYASGPSGDPARAQRDEENPAV